MNLTKEQLQLGIALLQFIGIPILLWIVRMVTKMHKELKRADKLNQIHTESLVDTLSVQYGNGEFRKRFDRNVERKKSDYKFIKE